MAKIQQYTLNEWQAVDWNDLDEVIGRISHYSRHDEDDIATITAFQQFVDEHLKKADLDLPNDVTTLQNKAKESRAFNLMLQAAIMESEAWSIYEKNPAECTRLYYKAVGIYQQAAQTHSRVKILAYRRMACICHFRVKDFNNAFICYRNGASVGDVSAMDTLSIHYANPQVEVCDLSFSKVKVNNPFLDYAQAAYYSHLTAIHFDVRDGLLYDCEKAVLQNIDRIPPEKKLETNYRLAMASRNTVLLDRLFKDPEQVFKALHFMLCEDKVARPQDKFAIFIQYETFITQELCNAPLDAHLEIKQALNHLLFTQALPEIPFKKKPKNGHNSENQWQLRFQNLIRWNSKQATDWKWLLNWYENLHEVDDKYRAIWLLEWVLSTPELDIPETACHFLYYILGTLNMLVGDAYEAKVIYSLIPYDAELPAEVIFDIGSLFLTDIRFIKTKPNTALASIKEDEKLVVDEKNQCHVDARSTRVLSCKQQTKVENANRKIEKRALPYLLTAAFREPDNEIFRRVAMSTLGSATGREYLTSNKKTYIKMNAASISRSYWIETHINPLHKRVLALLAQAKERATDPAQQDKVALTLARVKIIYDDCITGKIKTSAYREDTKAIIKEMLNTQEIATHKNSFTKIGRALLNILFVIMPQLRCTLHEQVTKTHTYTRSPSFRSYFFSLYTDRQVQAKNLILDLEAPSFHLKMGA